MYYFRPPSGLDFCDIGSAVAPLISPLSPLSYHLVIYISESFPTLSDCSSHHIVEVGKLLASFDNILGKFQARLDTFLKFHDISSSELYFLNSRS